MKIFTKLMIFISYIGLLFDLILITAGKEFTMQLINKISEDKANVLISPLSIYQILSLTANGAKSETRVAIINTIDDSGKTLSELNQENQKIIAEINKSQSPMEIANGIFVKSTLKKNFKELSAHVFSASVDNLESVKQINDWCKAKTHNKISKILDSLNSSNELLLINAVYFKADWKYKFSKKNTEIKLFDNEHKVPMMFSKLENMKYYEDGDVQVLELPYKHRIYSALVILPKKNINSYFSKFSEAIVMNYTANFRKENIKLSLPKFKVEYQKSLKEALSAIGMSICFNNSLADFSLISDQKLSISDVIHKTYLGVDEDGTEAAAITAVNMMRSLTKPKKITKTWIEMQVNVPFIFILRHQEISKSLFFAKVYKPKN